MGLPNEHTNGTSPAKPCTNKGGEVGLPDSCHEKNGFAASIPSKSGPTEQLIRQRSSHQRNQNAHHRQNLAPDAKQENVNFLEGLKTMLCKAQYSIDCL